MSCQIIIVQQGSSYVEVNCFTVQALHLHGDYADHNNHFKIVTYHEVTCGDLCDHFECHCRTTNNYQTPNNYREDRVSRKCLLNEPAVTPVRIDRSPATT